jgi:hypothetical protein
MESADRVLEVGLGALGFVLELEEAVARCPRLAEDLIVECHHGV